ncbi:hypothetical protein SAMN05660485_00847 [Blastococcus fimeti]|nr:hypothetical protein SAMN05660485_00847 [Blastococcus fimeti]
MRTRPALVAASAVVLLAVLVGGWLLLRPVDPAGGAVPAPITVPERSPELSPAPPGPTVAPVPPGTGPTDVVPPPPIDDDDEPDDGPDDGPDDDDDD